jgi:superfamily II DNA or RNA helicase
MWIRKGIPTTARRFINNDKELTSRINSDQITDILEELLKEYPTEKYPIDICLATNMISVGVDIPRLGIMSVIGQPKTTSEYIQATSRVGRSKKGPGLVVTIYNTSKPRDRSHYEHFQEYHSKIYSKVEPTSVTPFSSPARQRALHAILVGLIRFYSDANRDRPTPPPSAEVFEKVCQLIKKRVTEIDEEEVDATMQMLSDRITKWKNYLPIIYGSFYQGDSLPLMYPAGTSPSEQIRLRAWSTPTSMRNVDSTCDAIVINEYINIDR